MTVTSKWSETAWPLCGKCTFLLRICIATRNETAWPVWETKVSPPFVEIKTKNATHLSATCHHTRTVVINSCPNINRPSYDECTLSPLLDLSIFFIYLKLLPLKFRYRFRILKSGNVCVIIIVIKIIWSKMTNWYY